MIGSPKESLSKLSVYFPNLEKHNLGTVTHIEAKLNDRFEYCFYAFGCMVINVI